jgi:shikimate kinase
MTSGRGSHAKVRSGPVRVAYLVGFMGAGKSSVGRALSRRLGWRFEDLDAYLESREGRSVEQIFRESGEAEFRRVEHAALEDLQRTLGATRAIVALGGGTFAQAENAGLLSESQTITIFLDANVAELLRRCQADNVSRPLLRDEAHFRQLYESRRASYLGAALCIETGGKDVETVVAEIQRCLQLEPGTG